MSDWKPRGVSPDKARAAVEEAAREANEARLGFEACIELVRLMADRMKPPRITDVPAELVVIGWACSGRAVVAEFQELRPPDFSSSLRMRAYGTALAAVHLHAAGELPLPSAACREPRPSIALLGELCSVVWPEDAAEFEGLCLDLRVPSVAPQRKIDLVAALGRKWVDVEEQWERAPAPPER